MLLSIASLGSCGPLGDPPPVPYPAGCASFGFSARRCAAIVARARREIPADPVSIGILGPGSDQNNLGGSVLVRVVLDFADGTQVVQPVRCVGVPAGPDDAVCQEPSIGIRSRVDHDVPCTGEPPDGCPSRIVPDPAAVAAAHPLRMATFDVPIDGVGHREVRVGAVGLPNGYVTRVDARVLNDRPDDFWIQGGIILDLRPSDPARPPFGNVYQRPLTTGVEQAELWLVFDVTEASPGAVLHLSDIDVE